MSVWTILALWVGVGVGLLLGWLVGMTNPLGYLGVPPWRVPACTCDYGRNAYGHHLDCEITRRAPR